VGRIIEPLAELRAVLFDIGGTLMDFSEPESLAHIRAGIDLAFDHLHRTGNALPRAPTYRRRILSRFLRAYLWSRLRNREMNPITEIASVHRKMKLPLDHADLQTVARLMYQPIRAIARCRPDTVDTVAELGRRGYRLGIVSNTVAPPAGLDEHLADQGLLEYFPVRIYSCEVGVPKPDARIFRAALQRLSVAPQDAVYIGDRPRADVFGARRAGLRTVLRIAGNIDRKHRWQPDRRITQIVDLLALLPKARA